MNINNVSTNGNQTDKAMMDHMYVHVTYRYTAIHFIHSPLSVASFSSLVTSYGYCNHKFTLDIKPLASLVLLPSLFLV